MEPIRKRAKLVLEDGTVFNGYSLASRENSSGEVVFNTGMVGYPETLTDPSYHGQILAFTYPLIGNYGIPGPEVKEGLKCHFESEKIQVSGVIMGDYSFSYSHWNGKKSLQQWLTEENIPALYGVDTRRLTKHLRQNGTMLGKLLIDENTDTALIDPNKRNLVAEVSIKEPAVYRKGKTAIVLIDCGVKNNIIKAFLKRNITVIRYPWNFDSSQEKADGIIISNGPGNPARCEETIENVKRSIKRNLPIMGICLGSQILALAAGGKTFKLKYGHRGQNQPCQENGTRRCYITSQNHGYAVDAESLPQDWREWFVNNNDQTNEGIIHVAKPFFGTQFHPEASPGPEDTEFLFDMFVRAISS